jgi:hypothetical protein
MLNIANWQLANHPDIWLDILCFNSPDQFVTISIDQIVHVAVMLTWADPYFAENANSTLPGMLE